MRVCRILIPLTIALSLWAFIVLNAQGCSDAPTAVEPAPCSDIPELTGQWEQALHAHDDSLPFSTLTIERQDNCNYFWTISITVPETEEQVYHAYGQLIVDDYVRNGPILTLDILSRRDFLRLEDNRNTSGNISGREEVVIWGRTISIWGRMFDRTQ